MPDRRPLSFDRLDDVPDEVDRLLAGHETVGGWSLAQICTHLAAAIRLSSRVTPETAPVALPTEVERAQAIGRRRLFRSGAFPEGIEMPSPAVHPGPADADPHAAADALRDAVASFLAAPGPFPQHPMLGAMGKDDWLHFHRIHCAHHLSFARPRPADGSDRGGG